MRRKLLILGGTTEASALARLVAARGIDAVLSYAGRTERPRPQPVPCRVGGFGGIEGLAAWLGQNRITHVVDATHPFAGRMSLHAAAACAASDLPLVMLTRPPWTPGPGDRWTRVADVAAAAWAMVEERSPQTVFLAIGRQHVDAFAVAPHHRYLLRFVDPPRVAPRLPEHDLVVTRGPFTADGDTALMAAHRVDRLVSKNSGGSGARAKIDAARRLRLPVLMIDRPAVPAVPTVAEPHDVLRWLDRARLGA
jgi:precorrin-6A/cobalt-precorrin-6A reductase